eukprot:gb/GECG01014229.1/.p1 GENE.gb/GECG01014229.1/~~gb/GECG01014229.1/.p1  ORF type:complete len:527 (+),score=48.05 gb/GECG01014229.1/:1-1581(+)
MGSPGDSTSGIFPNTQSRPNMASELDKDASALELQRQEVTVAVPAGSSASPSAAQERTMETDTDSQKQKSKKRSQVPRACRPCSQGKRKCDHKRPCYPCVKRGIVNQCVDVQPRKRVVRGLESSPSKDGEQEHSPTKRNKKSEGDFVPLEEAFEDHEQFFPASFDSLSPAEFLSSQAPVELTSEHRQCSSTESLRPSEMPFQASSATMSPSGFEKVPSSLELSPQDASSAERKEILSTMRISVPICRVRYKDMDLNVRSLVLNSHMTRAFGLGDLVKYRAVRSNQRWIHPEDEDIKFRCVLYHLVQQRVPLPDIPVYSNRIEGAYLEIPRNRARRSATGPADEEAQFEELISFATLERAISVIDNEVVPYLGKGMFCSLEYIFEGRVLRCETDLSSTEASKYMAVDDPHRDELFSSQFALFAVNRAKMFTFTVRDCHGSLHASYEMSLDTQLTSDRIVLPRFMGHFVDEVYSRCEHGEETHEGNNASSLVHSGLQDGTLFMLDSQYLQTPEGKTDFQGLVNPAFLK